MAPRETKCFSSSYCWAGQERALVQRRIASPSGFTTGEPQDGQLSGGCQGTRVCRCAW